MMNNLLNVQQKRKRLLLLVLPLIVIPLISLLFWTLGVGKPLAAAQADHKGLSTELPTAHLDSTAQGDKLSIYQKAHKDSVKLSDLEKYDGFGSWAGQAPENHEQQVTQRLELLQKELSRPQEVASAHAPKRMSYDDGGNKEVARLERLMKGMQAKEADPEMKQLSDVLERIQEIQNPQLAAAKLPKELKGLESEFLAIPASVSKNHKAVQGSVVELVLLDSVWVRGQLIPKGHLVYGLASFSNQRLNLEIKNIRVGKSIIPVDFTVFDRKDAMVGINAPEALLSDALGQGSADAMNSIGLLGMSDNIGMQLAGAGMDAAKGLFNKKMKRIRQPLKKGYPLLLRDNSRAR
ncbi:conjugative transposon protein TraM [Nubsella zeaxanthinifaciens]|uniref:conjugative transposon protein TraM n=1 Tax=Nubsella zeaxanthinifaciens TaxID=392412 RepID=UPI003D089B79